MQQKKNLPLHRFFRVYIIRLALNLRKVYLSGCIVGILYL